MWQGAVSEPVSSLPGFLMACFNADTGRFRNFLGYDRRWLEDNGSEDSHGRAFGRWETCSAIRRMQD